MGILEVVEMQFKAGFMLKRIFHLTFGHDEYDELETVAIFNYLQEKGIEAEYVLDKGYAITQKLIPDIATDVAMIGIAEKL